MTILRHNLDHAAGDAPSPEIASAYPTLCAQYPINPHGITCFSEDARRALLNAEERLLAAMEISSGDAYVVWCATGTEALNLALRGTAANNPQTTICHDAAAHPAIAETAHTLAETHRVTAVRKFLLDANGHPEKLTLQTAAPPIVALSLVNNETGIIWDARRNGLPNGSLLIADGCQCLGKHPIPWENAKIDLLGISGRKIGGPPAAALICRNGTALRSFVTGGGQQNGLRAGTVDVPSALLLAQAAEMATANAAAALPRVQSLKAQLLQGLRKEWPVFSPPSASPYITFFSIPGYDGAVIARILAQDYGILVGTGSACAAEHGEPSPTLTARGVDEHIARGAIRVSLSAKSTAEDIDALLQAMPKVLANW